MRKNKCVKTFYKNIDWVYKTRSKVTFALAECLMFMTARNEAEVAFNSETRRDLATRIGASVPSVSRAMSDLLSYGVIAKKLDEDGNEVYNRYILNPKMYWYGDLPQRKRAMKKYGNLFGY